MILYLLHFLLVSTAICFPARPLPPWFIDGPINGINGTCVRYPKQHNTCEEGLKCYKGTCQLRVRRLDEECGDHSKHPAVCGPGLECKGPTHPVQGGLGATCQYIVHTSRIGGFCSDVDPANTTVCEYGVDCVDGVCRFWALEGEDCGSGPKEALCSGVLQCVNNKCAQPVYPSITLLAHN